MTKSKPLESRRSPKWPAARKAYLLRHPKCFVCLGTKKLNVHHMKPFHLHPGLELDPTNFITLCEGNPEINCHLFVGHLGNFKGFNPDVITDAKAWRLKLIENRIRIHETNKRIKVVKRSRGARKK